MLFFQPFSTNILSQWTNNTTGFQHLFRNSDTSSSLGKEKKKDYPLEVSKESFVYSWSERAVSLSLWSLGPARKVPTFQHEGEDNCNSRITIQLISSRRCLELQELEKRAVSGHNIICQHQPNAPCYGYSSTARQWPSKEVHWAQKSFPYRIQQVYHIYLACSQTEKLNKPHCSYCKKKYKKGVLAYPKYYECMIRCVVLSSSVLSAKISPSCYLFQWRLGDMLL